VVRVPTNHHSEKNTPDVVRVPTNHSPEIFIAIPVHNEEKVIAKKLETIVNQQYDINKINVWIGLDACEDNSINEIKKYEKQLNIHLFETENRTGKPAMLNLLFEKIKDNNAIVVVSDADILFETNVLSSIVQKFEEENFILADLKLLNTNQQALAENAYLNMENSAKAAEAAVFQVFQGVSGACYAIRKKYYQPVPDNFLVDDFYISTQAMLQHPKAAFLENTAVYENRPSDFRQEFRRKVRIATGNFQNLFYFGTKLLSPFSALGFTFISHKLLRWLTPFFLIYIFAYFLINYTFIFLSITMIALVAAFFLAILGFKKIAKIPLYFLAMQAAILAGFYNFLIGVKTNIWQPSIKSVS
jgi:cellulose synthase/poly-beta-1,6-N-acetylglucosamine synthase-like glycosyltransferase